MASRMNQMAKEKKSVRNPLGPIRLRQTIARDNIAKDIVAQEQKRILKIVQNPQNKKKSCAITEQQKQQRLKCCKQLLRRHITHDLPTSFSPTTKRTPSNSFRTNNTIHLYV